MNEETRQSSVELTRLVSYLDNHVSITEDEVLENAPNGVSLNPSYPVSIDLGSVFDKARKDVGCGLGTAGFIESRAAPVMSVNELSMAFEALGGVPATEGLTGSEFQFLKRAKGLIFDGSIDFLTYHHA